MPDNIVTLNQELIHTELKDLVRNSVEETLNAMLDAEADKLINAERYARDEQRQGYRVLFKNAGTLATELTEARDAYQHGRIERRLEKTDLLILDELSYMSFNKYESELLFKVISERPVLPSADCTG